MAHRLAIPTMRLAIPTIHLATVNLLAIPTIRLATAHRLAIPHPNTHLDTKLSTSFSSRIHFLLLPNQFLPLWRLHPRHLHLLQLWKCWRPCSRKESSWGMEQFPMRLWGGSFPTKKECR